MTHVVDVCGTLVHDDTTVGLLRYHFAHSQARPWRGHVLRLLTAHMSPARWAFLVLEKTTGKHWLKHVLVRLLAGDMASELDASGVAYAQELLSHRRVASVWDRLAQTSPPDQIILASASLESVVKALSHSMGTRYVASVLELRAGVLTGRYLEDLTGRKEEAIKRKFGADVMNQPFAAISDNLSDRSLLIKAYRPCVVLHRESDRARWRNLRADYVRATD